MAVRTGVWGGCSRVDQFVGGGGARRDEEEQHIAHGRMDTE